ncbi:class I SAM-dependent methyltransferase [Brumimicrobium salinarum]|uniref:class I SAM-dependent methyltransferase n=1 Tax=Brumimicrobium salinarum TaxID=2058658 RepID=UPI0026D74122|nr:class I SAM-dependent methyltransferase [Brumimicrobium salinarum]
MREFWDNRYADVDFAYGEAPNEYFKEQLFKLTPGKILLPGDGEGRNSVCAARSGWEVDAFDISREGKKKADQLAEKHKLSINYQVGALEDLTYPPNTFDVIALIFTHFDPKIRAQYRKEFIRLLKPGGLIISESFSKKHLALNSKNPKVGGPKRLSF